MSVSALDLLKTSAYSWYSSGIAERSIFSEIVVDLVCIVERDRDVSDGVNCRGFSAGENGGFIKVSTRGTEARLWSKDGGQKDIDPETQSINRL